MQIWVDIFQTKNMKFTIVLLASFQTKSRQPRDIAERECMIRPPLYHEIHNEVKEDPFCVYDEFHLWNVIRYKKQIKL